MTEYNPSIPTRQTDELISIAVDNGDNWQTDAIAQATTELKKRGVTDQELKEYAKQAADFDKQLALEEKKEFDARKDESYDGLKMIMILFLAPFYLLGKFPSDKSIFTLKSENYTLMFKQRLVLLILGTLCWAGFFFIVTS